MIPCRQTQDTQNRFVIDAHHAILQMAYLITGCQPSYILINFRCCRHDKYAVIGKKKATILACLTLYIRGRL